MDNQPATSSSSNSLARLWPWLVVLAVLIFVGFIRVRLVEVPLERDEGEYAYVGQLILQGIPPYELAYNMKLPGTYCAYAAGMAVFGKNIAGIHLTLLVANSLTIIFIFLLGRKLFGVLAGVIACTSYGIMSVCPEILGMEAHANHFVVLFAVPAILLLLKACESNRSGTLFFSGLLFGLAFLMKQQGICFGIFGWIFLVRQAARSKLIWSNDFAKKCFFFGAGMILPFAVTCLVLAAAGVFFKFWFWTFTYARSYAMSLPWSEGIENLGERLRSGFDLWIGFWLIAGIGLPLACLNPLARNRAVFVIVLGLCSFLGTATGLYFRPHYFILMLPAFAIIQGLAIVSMQQAMRFKMFEDVFKSLPIVFFGTILAWVLVCENSFFFQLSPTQVCDRLYQSPFARNPFVESLAVGRYIREHSGKDAWVAVLGSEPQIYFYAQRHSATGYIYAYDLTESQPHASEMQREMIREIESAAPEFLVDVRFQNSWNFQKNSDRTILNWFTPYAARFYKRVEIVGVRSDGQSVACEDAAAENFDLSSGEYLVVYKRTAETAPLALKTN
jgi:Dolichyl-phosphate-mannose-protein mannosyltransferase